MPRRHGLSSTAQALLVRAGMFLILAMVLATSPECDSPRACRDAARAEPNAKRAKEFRQRAVALEALQNAARRAHAVKPAAPVTSGPSAPPLVEAVGEEEPLAAEAAVEAPRSELPLIVPEPRAVLSEPPLVDWKPLSPTLAPEGERGTVSTETVSTVSTTTPVAPPTRVGISAVGGVETGPQTITDSAWQLRGRVGLGARFALTERRPTSELEAVPAVTLLTGYAGRFVDPNDHRVFGEARLELLAARPHGMLAPAFTAYLLAGTDVFVMGSGIPAEPYVGAGVGWDVNPFAGRAASRPSKNFSLGNPFSGIGHLGGGGGGTAAILFIPVAIAAVAVAVGAVIAYVCAGRFEVRYRPWTRGGQPTVAMMFGYGF